MDYDDLEQRTAKLESQMMWVWWIFKAVPAAIITFYILRYFGL